MFEEVNPKDVAGDRKIIPMRWERTKKYDAGDHFKKYKARMVCQGFRQEPGRDYDPANISSTVARLEILRIFIGIAASLILEIRQADVSTAFLNAHLKDDVIERPAKGIELLKGADPTKLWRLRRRVYGLKQSNKE